MSNIRKIIISIGILNIIDGILTYLGVYYNYAYEVNVLMIQIVESLFLLILVKIILTSLFLFCIDYFFQNYKIGKFVRLLIILPLIVYSLIFCNHLYILNLFFTNL